MSNWSFAARTPFLAIAAVVSMAVAGVLAGSAVGATSATPFDVARIDAPTPQPDGRWA